MALQAKVQQVNVKSQYEQEMAQLRAELEQTKAENAKLKASRSKALTCKVSEKGALSVYGLGRFPVTLYLGQWLKLLDFADSIKAFIDAHRHELSEKE